MKKFGFSLQYLLDTRRAKEQAAEQALLQAFHELAQTRDALGDLEQVRGRLVQTFEGMTGRMNRSDYGAHLRRIDALQRERDVLVKKLGQHELNVETCRERLQRETTARCVLENLSDREHGEWMEEVRMDEQKTMDELAAVRWSRQGKYR